MYSLVLSLFYSGLLFALFLVAFIYNYINKYLLPWEPWMLSLSVETSWPASPASSTTPAASLPVHDSTTASRVEAREQGCPRVATSASINLATSGRQNLQEKTRIHASFFTY
jgi:hypothetical protein